jgi:hypothetical protein
MQVVSMNNVGFQVGSRGQVRKVKLLAPELVQVPEVRAVEARANGSLASVSPAVAGGTTPSGEYAGWENAISRVFSRLPARTGDSAGKPQTTAGQSLGSSPTSAVLIWRTPRITCLVVNNPGVAANRARIEQAKLCDSFERWRAAMIQMRIRASLYAQIVQLLDIASIL